MVSCFIAVELITMESFEKKYVKRQQEKIDLTSFTS